MPFLFLLYLVSYLDRINVSYASLEMTRDLHFSNKVLGTGSGILFLGYLLLEIPGAVLVERWSARKWIARILVSWGLFATLTGMIHTAHQFYGARFMLGLAEAGFFPGVLVYLSHWYRQEDRAKAVAFSWSAFRSRRSSARLFPACYYRYIGWALKDGAGCFSSKAPRRSCSAS